MLKSKTRILENVIGIGGFPGVGKSTLVDSFSDQGYKVSYEFNETSLNNVLLILLNRYFLDRYDGYLVQIGFINHVVDRYKEIIKYAENKKPVFIDRTIMESIYFAKGQIKDDLLLELYRYEHKKRYEDVKQNIGLPEIYIHLTTTFEDAMERLKTRNEDEYNEKMKNIENFKRIYNHYNKDFKEEIMKSGIHYLEINTLNLTQEEVSKKCKEKLVEMNKINQIIE